MTFPEVKIAVFSRIYNKAISFVEIIVMGDCLGCLCKNNSVIGMSKNSTYLKPDGEGLGAQYLL